VHNVGGSGAMTTGAGIPIVVAENGATTVPGTFVLSAPVGAGPYQYLLFRGPQSGGDVEEQNTWYLRSASGGTPFYRPEGSIYGSLPGLARSLGIATVGTFHERNGDQDVVRDGSGRAWGRIFGEHNEQGASGELDTRFAGWLGGVQLGVDAFRIRGDNGSEDVGGFFFTLGRADGNVHGHTLGAPNAEAGSSDLSGNSFGAYYTHIGAGGSWYGNWYFDALAMQTFYEADGTSINNVATNVGGSGTFLSLEGGVSIALGYGVSLEGQGQLIYQRLDFGGASDVFSTVTFDTADVLTGRLGLRLAAFDGDLWRPYLKANIWQDWAGADRTIYASTHAVSSTDNSTALELGGGLVAEISDTLAIWAVADYTTDVAGNDLEVIRGNLGVKVGW
jgi:outer membrane autotransporter protein